MYIDLIWPRVDRVLCRKHLFRFEEVTVQCDSDGKKLLFAAELQATGKNKTKGPSEHT